jgi:hypothetical protein
MSRWAPKWRYGAVATHDDRHEPRLQHLAYRAIDAVARHVRTHFRHRDVAAIDRGAVEIDIVFEPVGEVFLRREAELARAFL